MNTRVTRKQKQLLIQTHELLFARYGVLKCFLNYKQDHELLVAAILSAQCTDLRVNAITASLFMKYKSIEDFANADLKVFEQEISSAGLFRSKAKNIINACRMLVESFNSKVPENINSLIKLPGVGRKTANVLLAEAFALPGFPVDTHVQRILNRIGAVKTNNPEKIEFKVNKVINKELLGNFSRLLIQHGRDCCTARAPQCRKCMLNNICRYCKQKQVQPGCE